MEQETHRYDDIIDLPHPTSKTHARMPLSSRAAQFAPFAALSGFEESIENTAEEAREQVRLSEQGEEFLDP